MESSFIFGFGIIHIVLCVYPSSLTQINYNVFQFHILINILHKKAFSAVITCIHFIFEVVLFPQIDKKISGFCSTIPLIVTTKL